MVKKKDSKSTPIPSVTLDNLLYNFISFYFIIYTKPDPVPSFHPNSKYSDLT